MIEMPIYTEFFKRAKADEDGAFQVSDEAADMFLHLAPATYADVCAGKPIYVRVEHELAWPIGKYDFVKHNTAENNLAVKLGFEPYETYFAEAVLVATPKMALI